MCIYIHYIHVYIFICVYICIYICIHVYTFMCVDVYHTYIYICIYIYTYMNTNVYIFAYAYICMCIYTNTYILTGNGQGNSRRQWNPKSPQHRRQQHRQHRQRQQQQHQHGPSSWWILKTWRADSTHTHTCAHTHISIRTHTYPHTHTNMIITHESSKCSYCIIFLRAIIKANHCHTLPSPRTHIWHDSCTRDMTHSCAPFSLYDCFVVFLPF